MAKLIIPPRLDESSVFPWLEILWNYADETELTLDFSSLRFSYPFGTLVLASGIRALNKYRMQFGFNIFIQGVNYSIPAHSYLGHIGFFKFIGLNSGNNPGQATGGLTYLPITPIILRQLVTDSASLLGPAIQKEAVKLSKIVLSVDKLSVGHPVPYCFREVIRNTFEHGRTKVCFVSAQRWGNNIEIAIVDWGCGIRKSLSERLVISSDIEAIKFAIKPGVSRVDTSEQTDDMWANSGFGLYVLSRLSRETGNFLICSGDSALSGCGNQTYELPYRFNGTAVKLSISRPHGVNVGEYIDRIIKEGEKIASQNSRPIRASKSTKSFSAYY